MAGGIEVAKAVVTIVPSLEGSQQSITKQLTPATDSAAESAGKSSGPKFASSFSGALSSGAKVIGTAVAASITSVAAMSASFVNAAKATAEYGDHIDKMAQKMGLSSTAYQEWDFIAQHSGTSMDSLKNAMVKLSTAADGGNEAFQALGISAKDAQSMSREELWNATISALTGVEDETERARLAQSLFGKGATEMGALLNMSSGDIDAMKQQAHDLGIVMSEEDVAAAAGFQDSLQNLEQSFGGLKNSLMSKFLPGLSTVMDGLTEIFSGNPGSGVAKITEGVQSITTKIMEMLPSLLQTGASILTSILDAITQNLPLIVPVAAQILIEFAKAIISALPTVLDAGLGILTELVKGIIDNGPALMQQATVVLTNFISSLSTRLPELLTLAAQLVGTLLTGIINNAPTIISGAAAAAGNFISGIISALPQVLTVGGDVVGKLLEGINASMPAVIEAFSTAMTNIVNAISDAFPNISAGISQIVTACEPIITVIAANFTEMARITAQAVVDVVAALAPYTPAITQMVETVVNNLPTIIDSFTGLATSIGNIIVQIVEAIAPYIPAITEMVTTAVENLPTIIGAFTDLVSQVKPIIESIVALVKQIGDTVVEIVNSVGTNLALIVDAFSAFNESLATPITAVGNAISGMITAISDGIVAINDSISGVLDKLAGVFDSIGQAALNAGTGFKTIADACIDLANNTSVIDLAATLGAVATGIKNINHEAKWAHDNKIGEAVAQVGAGLKTLVDYSAGVDTVSASMDTFAAAVKSINNETKGGAAAQSLRDYGTAIGDMVTNAGNDFGTLGQKIDDCLAKLKTFSSEGSAALRSIGTDAGTSMNTMRSNLSSGLSASKSTVQTNFSAMSRSAQTGMNTSTNAVSSGLSKMQGYFDKTQFNFGSHIRLPHFGMSGRFDLENGQVPYVWVNWYDKGGVFNSPTVIGVGEKRPEFVGALDDLREIVREETNTANITLNVYGSEGQNVRQLADVVMDRIRQNIDRREAAFA